MRLRAVALVTAVVGVTVLPGGWAAAQDQGIGVQDNQFAPASVTVTVGDTVTWTQSGSNPHSVTADDGSFDSSGSCPPGCMQRGDTFSHTFDSAGEFGYYCKIHGAPGQGMAGTVVVEAAAEAPADDGNADARDGAAEGGDGQGLPRTGGSAVLAGLLLLAAGAALVRRRQAT